MDVVTLFHEEALAYISLKGALVEHLAQVVAFSFKLVTDFWKNRKKEGRVEAQGICQQVGMIRTQ